MLKQTGNNKIYSYQLLVIIVIYHMCIACNTSTSQLSISSGTAFLLLYIIIMIDIPLASIFSIIVLHDNNYVQILTLISPYTVKFNRQLTYQCVV